MIEFEIAIIGGGIVGLSAAIAMHNRGYKVAIFDAGSRSELLEPDNSRVYALNHASEKLLSDLGVWDEINPLKLAPYQAMHIWDAVNSAQLDFDCRSIGKSKLGFMLDENSLKNALYKVLSKTEITFFANTKIINVKNNPSYVTIESEDLSWNAKWMIVADGGQSLVRNFLNVAIKSWAYNQYSITARIVTEKSHGNKAYQVFHPEGPLALLPLPMMNECAIVWSSNQLLSEQLMSLPVEEFNQSLTKSLSSILGQCTLISERKIHPLIMRHTEQYFGNNWILMGDAAHTMHPLAGLGLNVGLSDLSVLLSILPKNKLIPWSHTMLSKYQRQRKYMVWQIIYGIEMLKRIFSTSSVACSLIRGVGVRILQNIDFLKNFFIDQASRS